MWASYKGHADTVKILLSQDANIDHIVSVGKSYFLPSSQCDQWPRTINTANRMIEISKVSFCEFAV